MGKPLRLAIDFDGTLHDFENKRPGYKMGVPMPGAVTALRQLKEDGAIIVIHTIWGDTEQRCQAIAEWCRYFGIPFDFITNKKPEVDFFIDDRNIVFKNWHQVLEDISTANHPRQETQSHWSEPDSVIS